ncbi:chemotaxis protein [Clostridium carboxidivorans P7]|uniref:Methyl-accepting chemotaxis sensory transducer n=1 Tax=Clostridium carboxidivorans P7 TaxID=536227 RepID=C6PZK6_9CLOT|nr:methyl-accepting chemotaxis protein [Clostridium carboxidivorans]AKN31885.1 chemotaxis protein [Clostridium carboxidivorans P7]EET85318.1 methyl-accepting chemotaxis sensory transducer [Clostridium carboxidivorans P7]
MLENKNVQCENLMEFIVKLAPVLQKLVPLDCMIRVTDTQKYIGYVPGKKIKTPTDIIGMDIPKNDSIYKAINLAKPQRMLLGKEVLGMEFESTAIPICDLNGKVVGALALGIGVENRERITNTSNVVAASCEQTTATVEEIAASAGQLAAQQESLQALAREIVEQINETGKIIEIIRGVAHTSNMLGLNAAIESARAGEHGKGFSVVAKEIRKMAENSTTAIKDVENILNKINEKIEIMNERINDNTAIGHQQAAATEELSSTMEELSASADTLKQAASSVIG